MKAQELLEQDYGVSADVWSATSYTELARDANEVARWNRLHPTEPPRACHIQRMLGQADGVIVAASDYVKALPDGIDRWLPRRLTALGTDGFGRSEGRTALRNFFEVDAKHIVAATLSDLARDGTIDVKVVQQAIKELGINPEKPNPAIS